MTLNDQVNEYKNLLARGDLQTAYRGLMDYMLGLKTYFKNKYPDYSVGGNLYQGYMDMTYFSLFPDYLKERKLKIAIVLIHDKMRFEVWLSGVNKEIQAKYWDIFKTKDLRNYRLTATIKGADSVVEHTLVDNPDFDDLDTLTRQIENVTIKFIKDIEGILKTS
jgi:hypothetical protein